MPVSLVYSIHTCFPNILLNICSESSALFFWYLYESLLHVAWVVVINFSFWFSCSMHTCSFNILHIVWYHLPSPARDLFLYKAISLLPAIIISRHSNDIICLTIVPITGIKLVPLRFLTDLHIFLCWYMRNALLCFHTNVHRMRSTTSTLYTTLLLLSRTRSS